MVPIYWFFLFDSLLLFQIFMHNSLESLLNIPKTLKLRCTFVLWLYDFFCNAARTVCFHQSNQRYEKSDTKSRTYHWLNFYLYSLPADANNVSIQLSTFCNQFSFHVYKIVQYKLLLECSATSSCPYNRAAVKEL